MNKSKRTQMLHFQYFILHTFLDNLLLQKNLVDGLYFYAPLGGGTNERPGIDHVTSGPMSGLNKKMQPMPHTHTENHGLTWRRH